MQAITGPHAYAHELTDAELASYLDLANKADAAIKEAMLELYDLVKKWWDIPVSKTPKTPVHVLTAAGLLHDHSTHQLLDEESMEAMKGLGFQVDTLLMFQKRFENIQDTATCDAAHHLLWHAIELSQGREPMTKKEKGK